MVRNLGAASHSALAILGNSRGMFPDLCVCCVHLCSYAIAQHIFIGWGGGQGEALAFLVCTTHTHTHTDSSGAGLSDGCATQRTVCSPTGQSTLIRSSGVLCGECLWLCWAVCASPLSCAGLCVPLLYLVLGCVCLSSILCWAVCASPLSCAGLCVPLLYLVLDCVYLSSIFCWTVCVHCVLVGNELDYELLLVLCPSCVCDLVYTPCSPSHHTHTHNSCMSTPSHCTHPHSCSSSCAATCPRSTTGLCL